MSTPGSQQSPVAHAPQLGLQEAACCPCNLACAGRVHQHAVHDACLRPCHPMTHSIAILSSP